tara:strand:- start:313 stop:639 length:327 start_codon:yes stop_codon:yes gene_type:complete
MPGGVDLSKAKAWVYFNGTGTIAIQASLNVESITDNGTGDYDVNFAIPFKSSSYAVVLASQPYTTYDENLYVITLEASNCRLYNVNDGGTVKDSEKVMAVFFGELENE